MTLTGLHCINTRPAPQADALSAALRAAGAAVVELPLIHITPLELSAAENCALMDLDRYDGVFFISGNAAHLGLRAADNFWPQWPHQLPAFAVGERTAHILRDAALIVSVPAQENSEGLLALPALQAVSDKKFLLCKGEGGRELLARTLRERGARVDEIALYRRELSAVAADFFCADNINAHAVIFTSPDAMRHWQTIAGAHAIVPWWLVVSERMAVQARAAGARVVVAQGANNAAILAALEHCTAW